MFLYILPELFSGECLIQLNYISNKKLNTDLMTDIVMGIPVSRVKNMRDYYMCYYMCILELYNRRVVKMEVFMALRYLVR